MRFLLLITFISVFLNASSQDTTWLKEKLASPTSPFEQIKLFDQVAHTFMMEGQDSMTEVFAQKKIAIAERSNNSELKALAFYLNARRVWWEVGNKADRNAKFEHYLRECLSVSKANKLGSYEAAAYMLSGMYHSMHFEYDKALAEFNKALLISGDIKNDSLTAIIHSMSFDVYVARGEKVEAFRRLAAAQRIAEEEGNKICQGIVSEHFYKFYQFLGDEEKMVQKIKALREFLKYELFEHFEIILWSYINQSYVYQGQKKYELALNTIEDLLHLADSLKVAAVYTSIAKLNYFSLLFESKKFDAASKYYQKNKEVSKMIAAWQMNHLFDYIKAYKYVNEGNYDSALVYYKKADQSAELTSGSDMAFLKEYANCYLLKNDPVNALSIFQRRLKDLEKTNIVSLMQDAYKDLYQTYALTKNYEAAFKYKLLYDKFTDSMQSIDTEKELSILEIENENRRQLAIQKAEEENTRTRHNLQYMAITLAIAMIFTVLIFFGVFSTSKAVIKALGFLAFIMLFEFIILLTDNYIHDWTHGEPWKVLGIKICLIAALFPFHHFVEEKLVHHLITRKKLKLSTSLFSFSRKKPGKTNPPQEISAQS